MCKCNVLIVVLVFLVGYSKTEEYENEYGPDYGTTWVYYVTDNGTTEILNFTSLPADSRSFHFGDAYFHLYTRSNTNTPEELNVPDGDSEFKSTYFNSSNDVKVITHGWLSDDNTEWLQSMKNVFLQEYDLNVITVDWGELAKNIVYPWPALSTRYVGKRLAKLLDGMARTYQRDGKGIHLIGHSLGAQVMGYAGMFSTNRIARITGLDPARPLFELPQMPSSFMLEASDAEFVDIIHSCGGVLGYLRSHGRADFYPNSGRPAQPGCKGVQHMKEACSHGRSYEYFSASINSPVGFKAYPCENWNSYRDGECTTNATLMGLPVSVDSTGDYFLYTSESSQ